MRVTILLCLALIGCSPSSRFDQVKWEQADLTGRDRADMLDDFLNRYPLQGKARADVIALLGEPTPTDKWKGTDMIYVLGNDGSYFAIDNEWLVIDLDERQRVVSYKRTVV